MRFLLKDIPLHKVRTINLSIYLSKQERAMKNFSQIKNYYPITTNAHNYLIHFSRVFLPNYLCYINKNKQEENTTHNFPLFFFYGHSFNKSKETPLFLKTSPKRICYFHFFLPFFLSLLNIKSQHFNLIKLNSISKAYNKFVFNILYTKRIVTILLLLRAITRN